MRPNMHLSKYKCGRLRSTSIILLTPYFSVNSISVKCGNQLWTLHYQSSYRFQKLENSAIPRILSDKTICITECEIWATSRRLKRYKLLFFQRLFFSVQCKWCKLLVLISGGPRENSRGGGGGGGRAQGEREKRRERHHPNSV